MTRPSCRWLVLAFVGLFAAACKDEGPDVPEPPYLAIVTRLDLPAGAAPDSFYAYHIRDYAGNRGVDTVVIAAPNDTIIIPVPAARYIVTIGGVRPQCAIRQGPEQEVLIPEGTNTAIVRYTISCLPLIAVQTSTEGLLQDNEYIFRVIGNGIDRIAPIKANELVYLDDLPNGDYQVELADVSGNCTAINPGGRMQTTAVTDTVSGLAYFRVACSDPATRPTIVSLAGRAGDGAVAILARVQDPDQDLELYSADLTDCHGKSLLPLGGAERRNLFTTRLRREQPAEIMTVLNAQGMTDEQLAQGCLWFRVGDQGGNTSTVVEQPLATSTPPGAAPEVGRLNGFISGSLTNFFVDLQASDLDQDFIGAFARLILRDGVLGAPDGNNDIAIYNTIGYRGTDLPVVPVGPGNAIVNYFDILAVEVYLFDAAGHITRAVDDRP